MDDDDPAVNDDDDADLDGTKGAAVGDKDALPPSPPLPRPVPPVAVAAGLALLLLSTPADFPPSALLVLFSVAAALVAPAAALALEFDPPAEETLKKINKYSQCKEASGSLCTLATSSIVL